MFEGISFGKSWKSLNCGVILSTLSVIDVTDYLIMCGYDFVLTHRFNQDALENVFSQVRRRGGKTPSVLACLRALKIITISQFVSDVKKSSYCSDTDIFLIDYFSKKKTHVEKVNSHVPVINTNAEIDLSMLLDTYSLPGCTAATPPAMTRKPLSPPSSRTSKSLSAQPTLKSP